MAKWSTTRSRVLAGVVGAVLALSAGGDVQADGSEPPYLTEEQVLAALPVGSTISVRFDADLDGDGLADLAVLGGTRGIRSGG